MATGTRCGERAHSLSSAPYGVPSISLSPSRAGTWLGALPRSDDGSHLEGSRSTPVSSRRTSSEARACSRFFDAKNCTMSGMRRYGTVRNEIRSSASAWPRVPSKVGSSGMCSTSASHSTCRSKWRRASFGDASVPHRSPEIVGSGAKLPSLLRLGRRLSSDCRRPNAVTL